MKKIKKSAKMGLLMTMAFSLLLTPIPKVFGAAGGDITVSNFDQLKAAASSASSGQKIEIASNLIDCKSQLVLDKINSGITIEAASGYTPVLDFTSFREASKIVSPKATGDAFAGIRITGGQYTIKGLIIQKAYDNGMLIKPNYSSSVPVSQIVPGKPDDNTIIDCVFRYNGDAGLQISGSDGLETAGVHVRPNNNHVIGSVAYRNFDILTSGGNADGFAAKLYLGTGNVFSHCVSAENSDDAWDSFGVGNSDVTYEYCVAYHSGDPTIFTGAYDKANGLPVDTNMTVGKSKGNGNGFKMGSGSSKYGDQTNGVRNLKDCLAVDNIAKGFDENNGAGTINLTNGMGLGNLKGDYVLDLMTAGAFTNAQAFASKNLKAPIGGSISIVDTSKQAAIRSEVNSAISKMRQELAANKIPTYMNFSFWN
ncbi:Right handed beta helix region [Clostridium acidisoli DSM 12555]|uniref:Right handed beta helix region n=1 Tax=Clostridium acidisoli DSM 12555 TaxID=1121291 RepID=A0A1W1X8S5_9CLOT|nr:pectate lyase [Clostridium acidisoli]SMC20078.1 Right handed beta helix region [Clostridium acidisoli DSM 12555]